LSAESDFEAAIAFVPGNGDGEIKLVPPSEVRTREVGRDNWFRYVYDVIDERIPAARLIMGETVNPPGNWSSYPPHKHDVDNLPQESDMEEVYYFKVDPVQGFGIQRIYTQDRSVDEAHIIENDTAVSIPEGYHPVVAGAGYKVYYLWVLAGEKRVLKMNDDPAHAWIKEGVK